MLQGKLDVHGLDFFSRFANGSSLTTTTTQSAKDIPAKGIYRRVYAWNGVYDLYDKHQKHLSELKLAHGEAMPAESNLILIAESMDSFIVRQNS